MNVKLTKQSWHFKLQTWARKEEPDMKNLCPYFWTTVLFLFLSPVIFLFKKTSPPITKFVDSPAGQKTGKAVGYSLAATLGVLFLGAIIILLIADWLMFLALTIGVIVVLFLVSAVFAVLEAIFDTGFGDKIKSFFGFFWTYAVAAKDKVCPGIEWEEDTITTGVE